MIQQIIIGLIFIVALIYLGRMVYRSFKANEGCASGCGKCGAIDFKKIEQQLQENKNFQ
jgi:hypothetical protein